MDDFITAMMLTTFYPRMLAKVYNKLRVKHGSLFNFICSSVYLKYAHNMMTEADKSQRIVVHCNNVNVKVAKQLQK